MDATPVSDVESMLSYDELAVGDTFEAGETTLTEDEITSFAGEYDPQPFHLDHEAGEESMFGGLVASGLHTYCTCNRLATEAFFSRVAFMGGRGVDELRWQRPVRPGDTLSAAVEVTEKRVSESNPERGYVNVDVTGMNAEGETVITWTVLGMIRRAE
ncbi:acyl dehydratase [Halogeometricum borinquense DSM 11551]|uniref:Acyl dehydratase n=3 Tax=Halogeometricum borinquense TaxID=60847 RepID=L9UG47_HALBP|nr:MaoC family dehydratase [Halogeometricum borinquense]ELY23844.1 acyl dehydratase [Halogeometricum borinquense DSM 11551]